MNTNWKAIVLVGLVSSATTIAGFKLLDNSNGTDVILKQAPIESVNRFTSTGLPAGAPGDFVYAAEVATPTVVHIKSKIVREARGQNRQQMPDIFREFFGDEMPEQRGSGMQQGEASGSGVIISSDGYIVTNNHVVEGSTELEVTLNNQEKVLARVVGTDPSTDIAVIKVDEKNLPAIVFGNSDAAKVGEWVVAVGNPFDLESTVTAGIVSAKGRGLGIIGQEYYKKYGKAGNPDGDSPLESFIQTDAVVNPGNSGGALVNLKGELIGINTAIASPTGSFAGYAFAVPSGIVKKVSADLIKYGNVQRGYLGIALEDLDSRKSEEYGVKVNQGVYVKDFSGNSAGEAAGIKKGDVVVKVDGMTINTIPELQQSIGLHQPGDKVNITVNRNGSEKDFSVTLRNREGGSNMMKRSESTVAMGSLGAKFDNLTTQEKQRLARYKVEGGVKIMSIAGGKLAKSGVNEGFIITKVNGREVRSVKELEDTLSGKSGAMVQFEGVYPDAPADVYTFGFRM